MSHQGAMSHLAPLFCMRCEGGTRPLGLLLVLLLVRRASCERAAAGPSQVLVLGNHHSGTSMLALSLRRFGLHLGETEDLLLDETNPLKYWERRDVVDINKARLSAATPAPDVPAFVGYGFQSGAGRPLNASESAAQVVAKLNANRPWATKDPRMSLLADEWLGLMDRDAACVLTVPARSTSMPRTRPCLHS